MYACYLVNEVAAAILFELHYLLYLDVTITQYDWKYTFLARE